MENNEQSSYKDLLPALVAALTWMFGGWDVFLSVAVSMLGFDLITGLMLAMLEGRLKVASTWKGAAKKIFVLIAIAVAAQLDKLICCSSALRTVTCLFYIGNEGISIIENMGRAGVPIPKKVKSFFERLRNKES